MPANRKPRPAIVRVESRAPPAQCRMGHSAKLEKLPEREKAERRTDYSPGVVRNKIFLWRTAKKGRREEDIIALRDKCIPSEIKLR